MPDRQQVLSAELVLRQDGGESIVTATVGIPVGQGAAWHDLAGRAAFATPFRSAYALAVRYGV